MSARVGSFAYVMALGLLVGCNKTGDTSVAPTPIVVAEAGPLDGGAHALTTVDAATPRTGLVWSLPRIKSGQAISPARFVISVDAQSLLLGSEKVLPLPKDPVVGFDATYKRSGTRDLFLVPLADAVKRARAAAANETGSGARLELGPGVTYRMMVEILYTMGQTEVTTFAIAAPSAGGEVPDGDLAEIRTTPPKLPTTKAPPAIASVGAISSGPVTQSGPLLALTVLVVDDGIGLKARAGNIAPGCADAGPGLAFKNAVSGYRVAELPACLQRLKGIAPEFATETNATFMANPGVKLNDVIAIVDALRGEKRDLFPDVMFGVPR